MPLKSTGNVITRIKINKKNITVSFGKDKISLTPDAYAMAYLYVGKELDKKQIQELLDFSNMDAALKKAMALLKRGHYSEYKMRTKLKELQFGDKQINQVIKFLKQHDLINDEMLANDYLEYYNEKNFGKNRIIHELKDKGIFDVTVSKLKFPESLEKKKARNQIDILLKRNTNKSYEKNKQTIYASLISYGFDPSIITPLIEEKVHKNEKNESSNLKKDYELLYHRLSSRYEGQELYEKLMKTLRNKGYRYNDIKRIMEKNAYEND